MHVHTVFFEREEYILLPRIKPVGDLPEHRGGHGASVVLSFFRIHYNNYHGVPGVLHGEETAE
jgi:hypothetical protein